MSRPLTRAGYAALMRAARRHARRPDEAEDLLQEALAAALEAGRPDAATSLAWLSGVMRNKALMQARTAARRRRRDTAWLASGMPAAAQPGEAAAPELPGDLPPALRVVFLLAVAGHTRAEVRHLLRLSDEALRQRIASLRRRLASAAPPPPEPALAGALAFGSIRRGLLPLVRRQGHFATHDPDGHGFVVNFSRKPAHVNGVRGN